MLGGTYESVPLLLRKKLHFLSLPIEELADINDCLDHFSDQFTLAQLCPLTRSVVFQWTESSNISTNEDWAALGKAIESMKSKEVPLFKLLKRLTIQECYSRFAEDPFGRLEKWTNHFTSEQSIRKLLDLLCFSVQLKWIFLEIKLERCLIDFQCLIEIDEAHVRFHGYYTDEEIVAGNLRRLSTVGGLTSFGYFGHYCARSVENEALIDLFTVRGRQLALLCINDTPDGRCCKFLRKVHHLLDVDCKLHLRVSWLSMLKRFGRPVVRLIIESVTFGDIDNIKRALLDNILHSPDTLALKQVVVERFSLDDDGCFEMFNFDETTYSKVCEFFSQITEINHSGHCRVVVKSFNVRSMHYSNGVLNLPTNKDFDSRLLWLFEYFPIAKIVFEQILPDVVCYELRQPATFQDIFNVAPLLECLVLDDEPCGEMLAVLDEVLNGPSLYTFRIDSKSSKLQHFPNLLPYLCRWFESLENN